MTQTWLGIQIDLDLPIGVLNEIRHILEHVQFVSLFTSRNKSNTEDGKQDYLDFRDEKYDKFIAGVLCSTPKLTALQMDVRFILLNNLTSEVWSSRIIRDNLKNLESLELPLLDLKRNATTTTKAKAYRSNRAYYWGASEHCFGVSEESARNFEQFAATLAETAPQRLKRLWLPKHIDDCSGESGPRVFNSEVGPFTICLLNLLRGHVGQSLLELSIPADAWKSTDDILVLRPFDLCPDISDIHTVTIPHLKTLTTVLPTSANVNFETFLINSPALEELDIEVDDSSSPCEMDAADEFWEAFKRRCSASGNTLKKVHLTTCPFFWDAQETSVILDWSFLDEMKTLEDFQLEIDFVTLYKKGIGIGPRVLECLPKNKLTSLRLKGIHSGGRFWRVSPEDSDNEGPEPAVVVTEEVPLSQKLDLLAGFRNLKHLSFRYSLNALDDEVIQFIFREMNCLEELEVSHCSRLTDLGISGTGPQEEESERVSIRSLKGQSRS